jgi:hypothetical protein
MELLVKLGVSGKTTTGTNVLVYQEPIIKEKNMAVDFGSLVSLDEKKDFLEQTIQNLAFQGYQTVLRKRVSESVNATEDVDSADFVLAQIEAALVVHQEELDSLNGV